MSPVLYFLKKTPHRYIYVSEKFLSHLEYDEFEYDEFEYDKYDEFEYDKYDEFEYFGYDEFEYGLMEGMQPSSKIQPFS